MPFDTSAEKGFTLVELAIVLVVIGLLIGLGAGMVGPLMTSIKVRESKDIVGAAAESVNSWASGNNRLPDVAGFPTAVRSSNDAWGRALIYIFDNNLFTPATKDTICGRRSTFITLTDTNTGATISNVAYLIVSQGDDAVTNTNIAGTAVTSSARSAATAITANTTNDLVRWVTLDELRTKVGCQGAQLKIVNNELPPGTVSAPYPSAAVGAVLGFTVDGGATPGTLRWCVEAPSAKPLPDGLVFTPPLTVAIRVAPNSCNGTNPLVESSWISSATLSISGTPAAAIQGAYNFIVYVRDNNDTTRDALALPNDTDNFAQKNFVLTINP